MDIRPQVLSVIASVVLVFVVFELVRRRRLMERYALLWLFSGVVLLVLAVWRDLLETLAGLIGVAYAPSALFIVALGCVLLLLLHFSMVISRLVDQNKVLAQHVGLLRQRLEALEPGATAELQETEEQREPALTRR